MTSIAPGMQRAVRTFARSGVLLLVLLAALLLLAGRAVSGTFTHYPDLIAQAPGAGHLEVDVWPTGNPADPTDCLTAATGDCRLLLQFDAYVSNFGDGPLHIEGNPQLSGLGPDQVAQKILDDGDNEVASFPLRTPGDTPGDDTDTVIQYETTDDHNHFHFMQIMEYSLWDETQTAQVTKAEKVGFCLFDSTKLNSVPGPANPVYAGGGNFCQTGNPTATDVQMGTSEDWRDDYGFTIKLQWVDVTDVAPGRYYLAARPDPEDFVAEMDETNNGHAFRTDATVIPGHVAQDQAIEVSIPEDITLDIETYTTEIDENPVDGASTLVTYPKGTRELTIESLPANGTLTQDGVALTVGAPFTDTTVTYTPDDGYFGPDAFTFSAADSASPYPINPVVATVSIDVVVNTPPVIVSPGDQTDDTGDLVGVGISVSDADGHPVTLTAEGLPPGVSVSGTLLTGTPLIPGTYAVTLTADDDNGGTDTAAFTWTIGGELVTPFGDVGPNHIFAEDITWMYALGISLGCGDGSDFCPQEPVSREQIASFLARAFELTDGVGADHFWDDNGSVHEDNIDALFTAGVTNGCDAADPTLFCPTDSLSRAQFASLLVRALESLMGEDYSAGAGLDYFTDDDGSVHEINIDKLRYADVTQGCQAGLFCPAATLTRGQLAALLYRALG